MTWGSSSKRDSGQSPIGSATFKWLARMHYAMDINHNVKLNDGSRMPILGLGVWQIPGKKCEQAVLWALEAGYKHIDTAAIYGNEESVGNALKKSGVPREEIFVTTKIWNDDHKNPEAALESSLKRLQLDYVDLYLIHWPVKERQATWKELEKFQKEGKCKSIGVSNFTIRHLEMLEGKTPAVNQVEFNPFLHQKELLEHCRKKKIQLEAYSPLMHGNKLKDKRLVEIGKKYSKTPAQIVLRWALQKDIAIIPKSIRKERIIENSQIFDFKISDADLTTLDSMNENYRTCWDPTRLP